MGQRNNPPYMLSFSTLERILNSIKNASTPERFTQDFLASKLGFKGGTPKSVIPFLKRIGFLNTDATPTELYRKFRNDRISGQAVAEALKKGYSELYEINEYVHELKEDELLGVVVQATGLKKSDRAAKAIVGSFTILKNIASFEDAEEDKIQPKSFKDENLHLPEKIPVQALPQNNSIGMNLSYTINLNLPSTSDISVYNAIFTSLKNNLLR